MPGDRDAADGSEIEDDLSAELGSLAGVMRELAAPRRALSLLVPGTLIEETYEVARVLGVGGMGVVYAAREVRLGREVAVKVHSAIDDAARARLVREAEALARHKHPNVVAIYRAGEVQGQIYYAMELVGGGTLRTWLRRPRPRKQIVDVLLAAGEGVAAAHRAGLVHRDFKPENVLLGDDDRPRVADFGLAIPAATSGSGSASAALGTAPAPLAVTRGAAGTPRYMAPEQTRGAAVDERADQFAFCVTAWEALTGRDPFDGAEGAGRLLLIARGPAPARGLPAYLERALRRGLAAEASARHPNMQALLQALRADPAARRKRLALVVGSAALIAASATSAALFFGRGDDRSSPCQGPSEVRAIWGAARRSALATASPADASWREDLHRRVTAALDERAAAWERAQRSACRKHQIDRSWTAAQSELAGACLARRLRELDSAIAVLSGGALGGRALEVVALLPSAAQCLDPVLLAGDRGVDRGADRPSSSALPADPTAAAAAQATEAELDRAARFLDGGDVAAAQRMLDAASDARALAVPALAATKAALLARLSSERGDGDMIARYTEAFYAARRAGLLVSSVRQAIAAAVTASRNDDRETAERWLRLAEADVSGLALGAELQALLARSRAVLLHAAGRADDALVEIDRGLRLMRAAAAGEADDAPSDRLLSLLMSKASIEGAAGRFAEAVTTGQEVAALVEARYGPYHPSLARTLSTMALDLSDLGRHDEAIAAAARAVAITRTQVRGPNLELADHLLNLGVALTNGHRWKEAVVQTTAARAAYVEVHGEEHADPALCDANLTGLLVSLEDYPAAIAAGQRAAAVFSKVAPDHTERPTALMNLALAERMAKRLVPAAQHVAEAILLLRPMQGSRVILAGALRTQAWIDVDRGRLAAAARAAEEALALWLAGDSSPQEIARSELVLAEVKWQRGERAAARELVATALGRVAEGSPERAELARWRDLHR